MAAHRAEYCTFVLEGRGPHDTYQWVRPIASRAMGLGIDSPIEHFESNSLSPDLLLLTLTFIFKVKVVVFFLFC